MSSLIQNQVNLQSLNTMALRAIARYYCLAKNEADIEQAIVFAKQQHLPIWVLGCGSNVIFTQDFSGLVLHVANKGITFISETQAEIIIKVAAGEIWDDFLQVCLQQNWYGLENLAIIPGTVGAAPIQNIGAYGQEVADCIHQVYVINLMTGLPEILSRESCQFAYRESLFKNSGKGKFIITHVEFRLQKTFIANISYQTLKDSLQEKQNLSAVEVREAVIKIRQEKLPSPEKIANTGSFFKNPVVAEAELEPLLHRFPSMPYFMQNNQTVKLAAGWLIEQSGWKGKSLGPVGMYEKQALVLVNHGDATYADVRNLILEVQKDVYQKFGVLLEQEPIIVN